METKDLALLMLMPMILISLVVYVDKIPSITGLATSQQEESSIIGTYSVMPSFKAKIDYNLEDYKNIKEELDKIIDGCKNNPDIEKCLKEAKPEWNCMKPKDEASAILSSFADQYKECMSLKEDGVVCKFTLEENKDINKIIEQRYFEIILSNGYGGVKAELKEPRGTNLILARENIDTENLFYTGYNNRDEKGTEADSAVLKIIYAGGNPFVEAAYATTSQPPNIPMSKLLLFYKTKDEVKFIDSAEEGSFRASKIITLPRTKGANFCAKSIGSRQIYAYDDSDKTVKPRDIIYRFAVTFPISIPKSIENLEVIDAPKAENSVILKWDKPKESNIKSYSVYYSKKDFLSAKTDDIKKDSSIYKKSALNNPVEIDGIDLKNCIINPAGTPCKYGVYGKALEKDKLYHSKGKLIYLLSDPANMKDGEEYNFAVIGSNEIGEELDNDKSAQNNEYILDEKKNYRKAAPIDDLPPSSEKSVAPRLQQLYDPASKKVTFNFAEIPKTNADGSTVSDFKSYRVYYVKYKSLSQQQKAETVNSIMNSELNKLSQIQDVDYAQQGLPFFVDLTATSPESGGIYFFIIIAQDKSGNPKEGDYKVKELGAAPLELTII